MPPDDNAAENARAALAAKVKEVAREVAQEDRAASWDQLGFNIRTEHGMDRLRRVLNALQTCGLDVTTEAGVEKLRRVLTALAQCGFDPTTDIGLLRLQNTLGGFAFLEIDLHTERGKERAKDAFEWLFRSAERSKGRGKRILGWVGGLLGGGASLVAVLKVFTDWYNHR